MANRPLRVDVDGLVELRKALRDAGGKALTKQLQQANKAAAEIVARSARSRVPVRTGRTQAGIRAVATQTAGMVREGGARYPHLPWLDWGGKRPRDRVGRPRIKTGRYLYPALADKRAEVAREYDDAIGDLLRRSFGRTGTHG